MKSYRTAAALLGVFIILGLIGTWDEWKTKQEEKEKEAKDRLVDIDPQAVTAIDFYARVTPGDESSLGGPVDSEIKMRLERKDSKWHLVEPVAAAADDATVSNLLTAIKDYKTEEAVTTDKTDLAKFGLDKPSRILKLTSSGKTPESLTVQVGNKSPVGYSAYVTTDQSEKIFAGNQYIMTATNKSLKDFRDKSVVKIAADEVKSINYKAGTKPAIVISKDNDVFKITQPANLDGDRDSIQDLLSELSSVKAEDFKDKPSSNFAQNLTKGKDSVVISWTLLNGDTQTLYFGAADDAYWATFDPNIVAYKTPDNFKTKITKTLDDFRNRRIFNFDSSTVANVDIDGESYTKVETDWRRTADVASADPQSQSHIQSLLIDLEYAKTDKFLTANTPEVRAALKNAPQHRIKLTPKSDATPSTQITIDGWPDTKDSSKFLLRRSGSDVVYRVNKSVFSNTKPQPASSTSQTPGSTIATPTDSDPADPDSEIN